MSEAEGHDGNSTDMGRYGTGDTMILHLANDTLERVEAMAARRGVDPSALVEELVVAQLSEERGRAGSLDGTGAELLDLERQAVDSDLGGEASPSRPEGSKADRVEIYTDGGCLRNPGRGGWAAVLSDGRRAWEISGAERRTTSNRMEIQAAVEALRSLESPSQVRLHSDSAYLVNCMRQRWYEGWRKNGWRNSAKKPVKNADLWRALLEEAEGHDVEWVKVAGHAGNPNNERCHDLAQLAIRERH